MEKLAAEFVEMIIYDIKRKWAAEFSNNLKSHYKVDDLNTLKTE